MEMAAKQTAVALALIVVTVAIIALLPGSSAGSATASYGAPAEISFAEARAAGERYGRVAALSQDFGSNYTAFFERIDGRDFPGAEAALGRMNGALDAIGSELGNGGLDGNFTSMLSADRGITATLSEMLADAKAGRKDSAKYEKLVLQTIDAYEKTPTSVDMAIELGRLYKEALGGGSSSPTYTESGAPSAGQS